MYFEIIMILNFLLDFMILYGTKRILKINNKLYRIFISSFIGSFTTFILLIDINSFLLLFIKLLLSIVLIIISFGFNNIVKNTLYFYMISIIIGGCIYLLDINTSNNYLYLIILSFIVIYILVYEFNNYKNNYSCKYLVDIYYKNKVYKLEGFIDTGNRVKSFDNKPIILVNLNIKSNNIIYVPYLTLNNKGVIPCIKPDRVIINKKDLSNCLIGLVRDKFSLKEDCILPNKFKEELC